MKAISTLHDEFTGTIINFNRFLEDNNYQGDRESLSIAVTDLLYGLLKKWSTANNTFEIWRKAESKDFGNIIFIHADDAATVLFTGRNQ